MQILFNDFLIIARSPRARGAIALYHANGLSYYFRMNFAAIFPFLKILFRYAGMFNGELHRFIRLTISFFAAIDRLNHDHFSAYSPVIVIMRSNAMPLHKSIVFQKIAEGPEWPILQSRHLSVKPDRAILWVGTEKRRLERFAENCVRCFSLQ